MELVDIGRDYPEVGSEWVRGLSEVDLMSAEVELRSEIVLYNGLVEWAEDDGIAAEASTRLTQVDMKLTDVEDELMRRGFDESMFSGTVNPGRE